MKPSGKHPRGLNLSTSNVKSGDKCRRGGGDLRPERRKLGSIFGRRATVGGADTTEGAATRKEGEGGPTVGPSRTTPGKKFRKKCMLCSA